MRKFDPVIILETLPYLLSYLPVTLLVLVATIFTGSVLGFFLAWARLSKSIIAFHLSSLYIAVTRCTPPIVMLFIIYYGLPKLIQEAISVDINSMHKAIFVIISFSLLFAANMAELMRSAYQSVDKGQREAALSIGMSKTQAFIKIILPQAAISALPNFTNSLTNLMKDGSLAYTIGLIDMMGQGTLIVSRNYGAYSLEIYTALAIIYWVLTIIIEKALGTIENRLSICKSLTLNSKQNYFAQLFSGKGKVRQNES